MRTRTVVLCVALGAASGLAACGSDTPSVDEAKADFCESVAGVAQAEEALTNLNAESTVDDAQSAVSDLEDAVSAAKDAAEEVGQAEADALGVGLRRPEEHHRGDLRLGHPRRSCACCGRGWSHVQGLLGRDPIQELWWSGRFHHRHDLTATLMAWGRPCAACPT